MTANTMDEKAAQQINFQGDGDDWASASEDFKDAFIAAFEHKAGLGPHPGKRRRSHHRIREGDEQEERATPTESDLQRVKSKRLAGLTPEERELIEWVEKGHKEKLTEQEINLCLEQARQLGEL